jgi:hypothetical protein
LPIPGWPPIPASILNQTFDSLGIPFRFLFQARRSSDSPIREGAEACAPARVAGQHEAADARATLSSGICAISASVMPVPEAESRVPGAARKQRLWPFRRSPAASGHLVPMDGAQSAEAAGRRTIGSHCIGQTRVSPGTARFGDGLSLACS